MIDGKFDLSFVRNSKILGFGLSIFALKFKVIG